MRISHGHGLCLGVVLAMAIASGCTHDPDGGPPLSISDPAAARSPKSGSWNARLVVTCHGLAPDRCVGAYGFSVSSDGSLEVGPGPEGQKISGRISREELQELGPLADRELQSAVPGGGCEGGAVVSLNGGQGRSRPCAAALIEPLARLAARYYPARFPDPCIDAAQALSELFDRVSGCEKDADCAYLESDFLPWNRASGEPRVLADDCSYVPTLAAGNAFECVAGQLELLLKRDLARKVCEGEGPRPGCSGSSGFDPERQPSVCVSGKCRINPSVTIE